MGIMMSKDLEDRSELSRRIASDLRARNQSEVRRGSDYGDDMEDDEETKKTGRFTWVWIILIVLAIISLICILFI